MICAAPESRVREFLVCEHLGDVDVGVDLKRLGGAHACDADGVVRRGADARHEADDDRRVLREGSRDVTTDVERLRVSHGQHGRIREVEGEDSRVGLLVVDWHAGVGLCPVAFTRKRAVVELVEFDAVGHVDRQSYLVEDPVFVEGRVFRYHA